MKKQYMCWKVEKPYNSNKKVSFAEVKNDCWNIWKEFQNTTEHIENSSKTELFCENSHLLNTVNYFLKNISSQTMLWISLCAPKVMYYITTKEKTSESVECFRAPWDAVLAKFWSTANKLGHKRTQLSWNKDRCLKNRCHKIC